MKNKHSEMSALLEEKLPGDWLTVKTPKGYRETEAGVFYNVRNGSSFIKSKRSSENLSNQNKHL